MRKSELKQIVKEEVQKLLEATRVDTLSYLGSHGKQPKGEGGWIFYADARGDSLHPNKIEKKEFTHFGKYADAKKKAQSWAYKWGYSNLRVAP